MARVCGWRPGEFWAATPAEVAALLAGGDDYELLFTAAPADRAAIEAAAQASQTPVQRIGQITAAPGLRLLDAAGQPLALVSRGFDHFA